ncbi:hypothetical protein [Methanoculleus sediminis]|uniref:hypothetical protein n=1 Tax=Methanoculleus sediminis TaxID=1550566 RepID=UPI00069B578C|nr:hypothetical protein [Methanoculleus sediminis]
MTVKKSKPELSLSEFAEGMQKESGGASAPRDMPPESAHEAGGATAVTPALEPMMTGTGDAAPSLPAEGGAITGIAAWQNNKKVVSLWSLSQNRNAWAGIEGVGWKKLSNKSDSITVAFTMLAAHAREKGSLVSYREESDGMIHELYVW